MFQSMGAMAINSCFVATFAVGCAAAPHLSTPASAGAASAMFAAEEPPPISAPPSRLDEALSIDRSHDGLFRLNATVEGTKLRLIVDTGASVSVLTVPDAKRLEDKSVRLSTRRRLQTVNGIVNVESRRAFNVLIMGRKIESFDYMVAGGGLRESLIGQDTLSQLGPIILTAEQLSLQGPAAIPST